MPMLEISVVVIGRNESENLPIMIRSLSRLRQDNAFESELIYVDSASSDDSVDKAISFFDQVIVLEDSEFLCAAAGRNIGTKEASKDWVLYLDGDMELCSEFVEQLPTLITDSTQRQGFIGMYQHIYPDGSVRRDGYGAKNNYLLQGELFVRHFGGAVLLPRRLVLDAGNYNPSVFANEEIDLYTRIRSIGGRVKFIGTDMICHHTLKFSKLEVALGFLWPTKFLGKKFFGFGQLLASRARNRELSSLVRYYPHPFMFFGSLLFSALLLVVNLYFCAVVILVLMAVYITITKGVKFLFLYPGLLIQAILGWRRYRAEFSPTVKAKFINGMKVEN